MTYFNRKIINTYFRFQFIRLLISIILKRFIFSKDHLWKRYFFDSICIYNKSLISRLHKRKSIVIDCASSGEVYGLDPLCGRLKEEYLDHNIIISVGSYIGFDAYKAAQTLENVDLVIFTPGNFDFFANRLIKIFDIKLYLTIAFPFNPIIINNFSRNKIIIGNLLSFLRMHVVEVDGFITKLHFKWIDVNNTLFNIDFITAKNHVELQNAIRFYKLKRKNIHIADNFKTNVNYSQVNNKEKNDFYSSLKISKNNKIIIAGSTYQEDEIVFINSIPQLSRIYKNIKFIIVPRYPNRVEEIDYELKKVNVKAEFKSRIIHGKTNVIVYDKFGDLAKLYSIADIVFIGGSFASGGAHNIFEPAFHKKPIVFGSNNIITQQYNISYLFKKYPYLRIKNEKDFIKSIRILLDNQSLAKYIGGEFKELLNNKEESIEQNINIIKKYYKG